MQKMLVSASTYKDKVSGASNSSPFKDVPYTHWAAGYIKTAVEQGWLTGYLDGSYKAGQYGHARRGSDRRAQACSATRPRTFPARTHMAARAV